MSSEKTKMYQGLIDKYGLTKDDFWKSKDSHVIKSATLRRIARIENITTRLDVIDVKVIDNNPFVTAMATAIRNEGAMKFHYDASACAWDANLLSLISRQYPVEMAEKRAVDRAIIRALELDGVYSDSEADDFKKAPEVKIESVETVTNQ